MALRRRRFGGNISASLPLPGAATITYLESDSSTTMDIIDWTNPFPTDAATYQVVQWGLDGVTFPSQSIHLSPSATSYSATGLSPGTFYYFRIARTNATGTTYSDPMGQHTWDTEVENWVPVVGLSPRDAAAQAASELVYDLKQQFLWGLIDRLWLMTNGSANAANATYSITADLSYWIDQNSSLTVSDFGIGFDGKSSPCLNSSFNFTDSVVGASAADNMILIYISSYAGVFLDDPAYLASYNDGGTKTGNLAFYTESPFSNQAYITGFDTDPAQAVPANLTTIQDQFVYGIIRHDASWLDIDNFFDGNRQNVGENLNTSATLDLGGELRFGCLWDGKSATHQARDYTFGTILIGRSASGDDLTNLMAAIANYNNAIGR